ncbi:MAG: hypothetical protein DI629_03515 [Mesorhizobium amorphae]|nr:MAG: hypothetical protein DI629_03515 [Mesorhizobium amorphae]
MDPWKILFDNSPALGLAVAAIAVLLGLLFPFILKMLGLVVGDKSKLVGKEEIAATAGGVDDIKTRLSGVEKRLGTLEGGMELQLANIAAELRNRPTRDEIHALEKSFIRMEGRFEVIDVATQANRASLMRIEEQMYAAASAARSRDGRGS